LTHDADVARNPWMHHVNETAKADIDFLVSPRKTVQPAPPTTDGAGASIVRRRRLDHKLDRG